VGLYYSILSLRDDIRHFNITPAKVKLIKDQLTELLTGYGEVDILAPMDGMRRGAASHMKRYRSRRSMNISRTCNPTAALRPQRQSISFGRTLLFRCEAF